MRHRPAGVHRLRQVAADNPAPLKLLRRLGPAVVAAAGDGVLEVVVDLDRARH